MLQFSLDDLLSRQGKSYSLVNPPPDFDLEEGDIVYVILYSLREEFA